MESLRQCSQWIRGYVNDPRHQQTLMSVKFDWHQLCAAMDIVDDVDLALDAYLRNSFPADDGEKYLRIYGVLQALFVQQDALGHLVAIVRPFFSLVLSDVLRECPSRLGLGACRWKKAAEKQLGAVETTLRDNDLRFSLSS